MSIVKNRMASIIENRFEFFVQENNKKRDTFEVSVDISDILFIP